MPMVTAVSQPRKVQVRYRMVGFDPRPCSKPGWMSTFEAAQNRSQITQKSSKTALGPKVFSACGALGGASPSFTQGPPRPPHPVTVMHAWSPGTVDAPGEWSREWGAGCACVVRVARAGSRWNAASL
eukprot:7384955-Prymnesium_polylepis.1